MIIVFVLNNKQKLIYNDVENLVSLRYTVQIQ